METFVLICVVALLAFSLLIAVLRRYRRCPSDKIMVVYGNVGSNSDGTTRSSKCIHGGAAFVWPIIQSYEYLDLRPMSITVDLVNALSRQNIRINVPSSFTVGISTEPGIMQNAAERLLGLKMDQVQELAKDIIFGQLRLVIATMDIEEINTDRDKFLDAVSRNVETELKKIGLRLINVNVTDISDESGYIEALGKEAAAKAINDAKNKIREMVSKELGVKPENIEVMGKCAFEKGNPENKIVLSQLLESTIVGSATGSGFLIAKPGTKQRQAMIVAAEVEVDTETGEVKVIKMVTGGTCGKMINPEVVRGQYIGGAVQGIGEALFEKFVFDERTFTYKHKTFTDYKIPTALDVPEIVAAPMEAPGKQQCDNMPYGAFGVGEMGNCLMVPAISDAIHDAIGVRVSECPFTPELILEALEGKKNE